MTGSRSDRLVEEAAAAAVEEEDIPCHWEGCHGGARGSEAKVGGHHYPYVSVWRRCCLSEKDGALGQTAGSRAGDR